MAPPRIEFRAAEFNREQSPEPRVRSLDQGYPAFEPRFLDTRVIHFLMGLDDPNASYSLARLEREHTSLTDIEASVHMLDSRIFQATQRRELLLSRQGSNTELARAISGVPQPDRNVGFVAAQPRTGERKGFQEPGHQQTDAAQKQFNLELSRVKSEIADLRKRRDELSPKAATLYQRQNAMLALLRQGMRNQVKLIFQPSLSAAGHQTIEELRANALPIAIAEFRRIKNAPPPSSYLKECIDAELRARCRQIRVNWNAVKENQPPFVHFPSTWTSDTESTPDAIGVYLSAFLDREIKNVRKQVDEGTNDSDAINPIDKPKLLAEANKKLLEIETLEAALEWAAMQRGEVPDLRGDASPEAILNCRRETAERE